MAARKTSAKKRAPARSKPVERAAPKAKGSQPKTRPKAQPVAKQRAAPKAASRKKLAPKPAPKPSKKPAPKPAAKAPTSVARSTPRVPPPPTRDEAHAAFAELRSMLLKHAQRLRLVSDRPGEITFEAGFAPEWNRTMYFGAAQMNKSYVSYHLFPVYVFPELLDGVSAQLKSRMQGKSCFNFDRPDPKLFAELGALTERGFERFGRAGWLR